MKFEQSKDTENTFTRRTIVLGAGIGAVFTTLGLRLYQIQVRDADKFALLSEDNQFNYRLLAPSRGRILDRFGVPIAENEENYTVLIVPENAKDAEAVLDRLAEVAPLSEERKEQVLREIARTPGFRSITVVDDLNWREFAQVNLHAPELPGVLPIVGETRFYPRRDAFAHITGYVGKADEATAGNDPLLRSPGFRVGRDGMERALDLQLRGKAGSLKTEVDAFGRVVRELPDPETAAQAGGDIRLTLDAELQEYAVERISTELASSTAVIDVQTGDILALASQPAYDPNHFARGMSQTEYDMLRGDEREPLFQKAFAGTYPPGSTFKPVVAMAAQRHGVIDPNERIHCGGSVSLGRARFHCWKVHGAVDMRAAFKGSCDIYFYEVARRLGIDRLAEVAREFGMGHAPDLPLPGVRAGNIPDEAWKRAQYNEPWTTGDSLNAGIGQGYVTASPLQLALMTARMASGRMVMPRLVLDGASPDFEHMDYADDWLAVVREGMREVCEEVGGTANYYLGGGLNYGDMQMGGKSGTAQVRRITAAERAAGLTDSQRLPYKHREHALFIGFAPFDKPRYACAAVAEHASGGGSRVAGPMVRDILVHALERNSGRRPDSPLASL